MGVGALFYGTSMSSVVVGIVGSQLEVRSSRCMGGMVVMRDNKFLVVCDIVLI